MRIIRTIAALLMVACAPDPVWALFQQRPPAPEQCTKWDCQGGIICSCCFEGKGCYVCDTIGGSKPFFPSCTWEKKIGIQRNSTPVPGQPKNRTGN